MLMHMQLLCFVSAPRMAYTIILRYFKVFGLCRLCGVSDLCARAKDLKMVNHKNSTKQWSKQKWKVLSFRIRWNRVLKMYTNCLSAYDFFSWANYSKFLGYCLFMEFCFFLMIIFFRRSGNIPSAHYRLLIIFILQSQKVFFLASFPIIYNFMWKWIENGKIFTNNFQNGIQSRCHVMLWPYQYLRQIVQPHLTNTICQAFECITFMHVKFSYLSIIFCLSVCLKS